MNEEKFICEHSCKISCKALHSALKREYEILKIYKDVVDECSLPDIQSFIENKIREKRTTISGLLNTLNEMKVKSEVIDQIAESYENI